MVDILSVKLLHICPFSFIYSNLLSLTDCLALDQAEWKKNDSCSSAPINWDIRLSLVRFGLIWFVTWVYFL